MKILYIHQHFITNEGTGGTRSYDVSKRMVELGHEVTVLCGDYWQSNWAPMPGWDPFETRWVDGIKVIRCNVRYDNKMGRLGRAAAFLKFAALASVAGLFEPDVDLVFATSTPLTVGLPARVISDLRRLPYVFEVRDIWPEDLIIAGMMREGSPSHRFFSWVEELAYARARKILTVSEGFTQRLAARGLSPERLQTIPLGASGELFEELEPDHDFLAGLGLEGKTVAVYAGAHGIANGLDAVLDAADHLKHRDELAFLLVGDGMMKEQLHEQARARELHNVHFAPPMPKVDLLRVLKACHIGLMILMDRGEPWLVTPNKLFDYMFTGLPVVVNFDGTTADLVEGYGCGTWVARSDTEALAQAIDKLVQDPELRQAQGRRAKEAAFRDYDRARLAERMLDCFQGVLDQGQ